jgi:two-component system, chemotaxis family, sensor histidine kinase and response regulator WspE
MSARDLSQMSMRELFRLDAESQVQALTSGLLALERNPTAADQLEICMRAAHSLKGAARIVGLDVGVKVTHAMEDCFVAAQLGAVKLTQAHIDVLLRGVDLVIRIADTPEADTSSWAGERQGEISGFLDALTAAIVGRETAQPTTDAVAEQTTALLTEPKPQAPAGDRDSVERVLRVTAETLNRLLGLAGESLVGSRRLKHYTGSMLRLKRLHYTAGKKLDRLREILAELPPNPQVEAALADARHQVHECQELVSQRLDEVETFDSRSADLAHRLYDAALACRMRPFADGVRGFPRSIRDLGRSLGKQVRLEIVGATTQVDRDILEKLDAPLGHLLRNAIDHGIESPDERLAAGKPAEGVVRLEARHSAGLLQITASDDGRGIDLDSLRVAIVERKLTSEEIAHKLSEAELLEFLFLPGFSMKETVTEISGRGVGLDAVQDMIKQVRGTVRISSQLGKGACFQLQLPLTLSVVRTLLVDIGGEPYAFPLAHIVSTLKLPKEKLEILEGRQHFKFDGRSVGLVSAQQVLGGREPCFVDEDLPVLIVGHLGNTYGLIADRFLGERELVVQPLDPRFGKIKDIAAGALLEDGLPVLIVDVEDMLQSVEKLVAAGRLSKMERVESAAGKVRKRVLVVDDSLTVRELERKLLDRAGYEVEVTVDGMDGWNTVRAGHFDLIVTDVDMPRMDGIELVTRIKKDPKLKSLPVMIVSYKDREDDRRRGLEAGADYYLTKGSFHDETLLNAVVDLIGEAVS